MDNELIEQIVRSSRLLTLDVANIILEYVRHPYYDVAKKMRKTKAVSSTSNSRDSYSCVEKRIFRNVDVVWNIKYIIPKSNYYNAPYTMEISISGNLFASGVCDVISEGDDYVLSSLNTSVPIPMMKLTIHHAYVVVKDSCGMRSNKGTLSMDGVFLNTEARETLLNTVCIYISDGLMTSGMFACLNGIKRTKGVEVFPSMYVTNFYENS